MKTTINDNGSITLMSENGAESFILKRFEKGVGLSGIGVFAASDPREDSFSITIVPIQGKEKNGEG